MLKRFLFNRSFIAKRRLKRHILCRKIRQLMGFLDLRDVDFNASGTLKKILVR